MECSVLWHFIWVFIDCLHVYQSTCLGVISIHTSRIKMDNCSSFISNRVPLLFQTGYHAVMLIIINSTSEESRNNTEVIAKLKTKTI